MPAKNIRRAEARTDNPIIDSTHATPAAKRVNVAARKQRKRVNGVDPGNISALTFAGLHSAGFDPIPVHAADAPVDNPGKRPVGNNWQNLKHGAKDFEKYEAEGHSIGLRCTNIVGLDIDVDDDPKLADAVEDAVRRTLGLNGTTPRRVGRAPKRLLVARPAEPVASFDIIEAYTAQTDEGPKEKHRTLFQLLGPGKQFVARGIHPDTGKPYEWTTPLTKTHGTLPVVTTQQVEAMQEAVTTALREAGRNVEVDAAHGAKQKPSGNWSAPDDWTNTNENNQRAILEALTALDPGMSMKQWVEVGFALHDGFHGSDDGLAIWDEWSQGSDKYRKPKYPQRDLAKRWRKFKAGGKVTRACLFKNDWPKVARTAREGVDEALRANDAFAFVRSVDDVMQATFEPADPVIDGLLYSKGFTMFYGKQKEGKSFALMQVMSAASSGTPLWPQLQSSVAAGEPFAGFAVPAPVDCLMLCAEDHGARLQRRFKELRERGVLPKRVARFDMMLREDVTKLASSFKDDEDNFTAPGVEIIGSLIHKWAAAGIKVIAFDTLATIEQAFCVEHPGKDVKAREYAQGTFYDKLADELGISIIGTGHMRKGRGKSDDGLTPLDLVNTTGAANAGISHFWALVRLPEQLLVLDEDSRGKERMFFATGREIEDDPKLHFRQGEDGFGGLWVNYGTVSDVEVGARCREYLAVLEALWGEKPKVYTSKEIAEAMGDGTKQQSVKQMLHRFAKRGLPWKHWKLSQKLGPGGGWSLVG